MSRIEGGNNYEKMYKMSTTLRRFARCLPCMQHRVARMR